VVVYTGGPATMVAGAGPTYLGNRWVAAAAYAGACTATPAPPSFAVQAKQNGPPVVPATSQSFVVVASDQNLNFLDTATSYKVEVLGGAQAKAAYRGLAAYADELGFFYRYWPCDQAGACASQCRATGANAPCEMRPALSGFSCGVAAGVSVTGGDQPDAGLVEIDWTVVTPWDVFLSSKSLIVVRPLLGTSI
jgi:hypothetical protein